MGRLNLTTLDDGSTYTLTSCLNVSQCSVASLLRICLRRCCLSILSESQPETCASERRPR